jgi:predicted acyl esterase
MPALRAAMPSTRYAKMIGSTARQSTQYPRNAPRDEALLLIGETKLPDRRNCPETERDYESRPLTTEFGYVGTHHQHHLSAGLPELSRQCSAASSSLGLNLDLMEG